MHYFLLTIMLSALTCQAAESTFEKYLSVLKEYKTKRLEFIKVLREVSKLKIDEPKEFWLTLADDENLDEYKRWMALREYFIRHGNRKCSLNDLFSTGELRKWSKRCVGSYAGIHPFVNDKFDQTIFMIYVGKAQSIYIIIDGVHTESELKSAIEEKKMRR